MTVDEVLQAYGERAVEYADRLGAMGAVHPEDRDLVLRWALHRPGPIIDAGCGPGHWTDFLTRAGVEVEGTDLVPAFVAQARDRFPAARFREAASDDLGVPDGSLAGVLAWYSTIHTPPEQLAAVLAELARCLAPGGSLLLGFFEGPAVEAFAHAVVTAYRWPVERLAGHLQDAGFAVREIHTRTDPGARPHGAIVAEKRRLGGDPSTEPASAPWPC
ncbi:class I SAM-dependent methyltransferase [Rhodococcus sp. X156]|uniref:class I SAM-dependent methyltransferase n=1 Tax=Rhodococcus sp. X156 TaxID=2499145 RepID=UPI001F4936B7|nr:class I SAM-dependent methyltransferase [Rhodococcus sp. X156]